MTQEARWCRDRQLPVAEWLLADHGNPSEAVRAPIADDSVDGARAASDPSMCLIALKAWAHYCQRGLPFTSSGGRTESVWKRNIRLGCKALRLKAKQTD